MPCRCRCKGWTWHGSLTRAPCLTHTQVRGANSCCCPHNKFWAQRAIPIACMPSCVLARWLPNKCASYIGCLPMWRAQRGCGGPSEFGLKVCATPIGARVPETCVWLLGEDTASAAPISQVQKRALPTDRAVGQHHAAEGGHPQFLHMAAGVAGTV